MLKNFSVKKVCYKCGPLPVNPMKFQDPEIYRIQNVTKVKPTKVNVNNNYSNKKRYDDKKAMNQN